MRPVIIQVVVVVLILLDDNIALTQDQYCRHACNFTNASMFLLTSQHPVTSFVSCSGLQSKPDFNTYIRNQTADKINFGKLAIEELHPYQNSTDMTAGDNYKKDRRDISKHMQLNRRRRIMSTDEMILGSHTKAELRSETRNHRRLGRETELRVETNTGPDETNEIETEPGDETGARSVETGNATTYTSDIEPRSYGKRSSEPRTDTRETEPNSINTRPTEPRINRMEIEPRNDRKTRPTEPRINRMEIEPRSSRNTRPIEPRTNTRESEPRSYRKRSTEPRINTRELKNETGYALSKTEPSTHTRLNSDTGEIELTDEMKYNIRDHSDTSLNDCLDLNIQNSRIEKLDGDFGLVNIRNTNIGSLEGIYMRLEVEGSEISNVTVNAKLVEIGDGETDRGGDAQENFGRVEISNSKISSLDGKVLSLNVEGSEISNVIVNAKVVEIGDGETDLGGDAQENFGRLNISNSKIGSLDSEVFSLNVEDSDISHMTVNAKVVEIENCTTELVKQLNVEDRLTLRHSTIGSFGYHSVYLIPDQDIVDKVHELVDVSIGKLSRDSFIVSGTNVNFTNTGITHMSKDAIVVRNKGVLSFNNVSLLCLSYDCINIESGGKVVLRDIKVNDMNVSKMDLRAMDSNMYPLYALLSKDERSFSMKFPFHWVLIMTSCGLLAGLIIGSALVWKRPRLPATTTTTTTAGSGFTLADLLSNDRLQEEHEATGSIARPNSGLTSSSFDSYMPFQTSVLDLKRDSRT